MQVDFLKVMLSGPGAPGAESGYSLLSPKLPCHHHPKDSTYTHTFTQEEMERDGERNFTYLSHFPVRDEDILCCLQMFVRNISIQAIQRDGEEALETFQSDWILWRDEKVEKIITRHEPVLKVWNSSRLVEDL